MMNGTEEKITSAISPIMKEKIEKIFARWGEGKRMLAEEDPEACILSLLTHAEEVVYERHGDYFVIEPATYAEGVKEARKLLNENKGELAASSV
jgi:hypothetical protein